MTFFESLLLLLLAAVLLSQIARRLALPYPALLALAGVAVAFIPGAPTIAIDPRTALPLFIAPVLLDAAFDYPTTSAGALWRPLVALAGGAVLITAAVVAGIGWWVAGLPLAAACVLGAIVAPPDAAAAVAVMQSVSLPRGTVGVLKGESLFNDAVALLLFSAALAIQTNGGLDGGTALRIGLAVPGGILFGVAAAYAMRWLNRFLANSLGGNLMQFVNAFLIWIIADRLHLSAVLAVVACAMTIASQRDGGSAPRMRVQSFAVWAAVVFLLNVVAFMLMGMQARLIVGRLSPERLWELLRIAGLVVTAIIVTRFAVVLAWHWLARRLRALIGDQPVPTYGQAIVTSWSGMRGLVTLATAFALPANFPQRDLVVLTAFAVVLVTLVVQGMTLAPLVRLVGLDRLEDRDSILLGARQRLAKVALAKLAGGGADDLTLNALYQLKNADPPTDATHDQIDRFRRLGLGVVEAQRAELLRLRDHQEIEMEVYYLLQEELDWRSLTLLPDSERRIDEA